MCTELSVYPWESLEAVPDLTARPDPWRRRMGPYFTGFRNLCLDLTDQTAEWSACPRGCGCRHRIIPVPSLAAPGEPLFARCTCTPPLCPPFPVTRAELAILEINRRKLALGICRALGLEPKFAILQTPFTVQVGTWSAGAVPTFLTIAVWRSHFRSAVADLVARLKAPFIHLAPTTTHFDAYPQELLASVGAAFFSLDQLFTLTEHGVLIPNRTPGELFARFNPKPIELPEDVARRAFALIERFEATSRIKPPTVLTVFRLYCIYELSVYQIAPKCDCSIATIANRLNLIRSITGTSPRELRRYSPYFAKMHDAGADSRARHTHYRTDD